MESMNAGFGAAPGQPGAGMPGGFPFGMLAATPEAIAAGFAQAVAQGGLPGDLAQAATQHFMTLSQARKLLHSTLQDANPHNMPECQKSLCSSHACSLLIIRLQRVIAAGCRACMQVQMTAVGVALHATCCRRVADSGLSFLNRRSRWVPTTRTPSRRRTA